MMAEHSDLYEVITMFSDWVNHFAQEVNMSEEYYTTYEDGYVWDHFRQCCLEILMFLVFLYLLKTRLLFDVFGEGPIAFLIHSVTITR